MAALALSVVTLTGSCMVVHAETGYTYGYDYWGDVQYSPDAYKTVAVYTDVELGLDKKLSAPQGLFVTGNMIYCAIPAITGFWSWNVKMKTQSNWYV